MLPSIPKRPFRPRRLPIAPKRWTVAPSPVGEGRVNGSQPEGRTLGQGGVRFASPPRPPQSHARGLCSTADQRGLRRAREAVSFRT